MRGDRPWKGYPDYWSDLFTPHARGSTLLYMLRIRLSIVYPACAGIDLESKNRHGR